MTAPIRCTVVRYRCPFCRYSRAARKSTVDHVTHCYRNPERTPREGELTSIEDAGRVVNYGSSSALPGDMDWLEWNEHDEMPKWWPGPGKIWDGQSWQDVPGWHVKYQEGAHGCAGGAPPYDVWPNCMGKPLDEWLRVERLGKFYDLRLLAESFAKVRAEGVR